MPDAPRPVVLVTADGAEIPVDASRLPEAVTNAVVAALAWSDGDDRRGLVGAPCTTPSCPRTLAITPPRLTSTVYVCAAAAAGYCRALHGRPHPMIPLAVQGPPGPAEPAEGYRP